MCSFHLRQTRRWTSAYTGAARVNYHIHLQCLICAQTENTTNKQKEEQDFFCCFVCLCAAAFSSEFLSAENCSSWLCLPPSASQDISGLMNRRTRSEPTCCEYLGYRHFRKNTVAAEKLLFMWLFFYFASLRFQVKSSWCPTTDQTFKNRVLVTSSSETGEFWAQSFCQLSNQATVLGKNFLVCLRCLILLMLLQKHLKKKAWVHPSAGAARSPDLWACIIAEHSNWSEIRFLTAPVSRQGKKKKG